MKKIKWISVEDRLPDNAKDKDALCETVLVFTKYGITQGWFKPGDGWFIIAICLYYRDDEETDIIDFERGDIPVCMLAQPGTVTHWMPLPEPPNGGLVQVVSRMGGRA